MVNWRVARAVALSFVVATTAVVGVYAVVTVTPSSSAAVASPRGLPGCTIDELPAVDDAYGQWATTLLDPAHTLGPAYKPPDLRRAEIRGQQATLRAFVIEPLTQLLNAAAADGFAITVNSSYRSFADQRDLVGDNPGEDDLIAQPGHSEHQLGTALDLSGNANWLEVNAPRFGFVLSYPAARSPEWTCYSDEPWHFRYFGTDQAEAIEKSGLSPREWLWSRDSGG